MPELPEVETIVRAYRARVTGRRIEAFDCHWARQAAPSVAAVRRGVLGRSIEGISRRGKFIRMDLSGEAAIFVHLRMSGRFEWLEPGGSQPAHVRAAWRFAGGAKLLFCDARKFGRIIFAANGGDPTGRLGIEPLSRQFTPGKLAEILDSRRRRLKALLLDQTVIAGLGNIYTDEALFRAGLHPLRLSDQVTRGQAQLLHASIRAVLNEGLRRNGASLDWVYPGGQMQNHFRVYGRDRKPCVVCGLTIKYLKVGQRGTHICPSCQPLHDAPP